ncbi:MAG: hypothetical protein K6A69_09165 [Lachnospiraceae bacterium]|nr:hypothetical protein [Lachnospiraceae bacterium]
MAVGKSSMARAAKSTKSSSKPAAKKAVKKAAESAPVKETAVIAAPSEEVMKKVVYQESSQVLKRDAKPGETFGVGDSMPIYFL